MRVWHEARVERPYRLGEGAFVDKDVIIHSPALMVQVACPSAA